MSKSKARELRRLELDTKARLGIATAKLHEDLYNIIRQGEVSHLQDKIDGIEIHRARGATIRARIKWKKVGDKCTAEFFKSVRQKKSQAVISSLKDKHSKTFTNRVDLDSICYDFYENLYKYREVSEEALREVFEGFPVTFTDAMNVALTQDIMERELASALTAMAKGKAPGHDGIPMEFFKHLWHTIGGDYHQISMATRVRSSRLREVCDKGVHSLLTSSLLLEKFLPTLLRRRRRKVESEELRYPEVGDNKVLFNTRTIPHL